MTVLTDSDVAVLNAARMILRRVESETRTASFNAESTYDAVFNLLNVTNTYTDTKLTHAQLHMSPESPVDGVTA